MEKLIKFWRIIAILAVIGFVATACDDGTTPNIDLCANGHTQGAAATCETAQICTVCGYVIKAELGHNWGEWESDALSATCTSASKDTASCLNQNCTKTDERTGNHSALGHDLPGAKAATCVATGLTGIGHCNRCNEDLTGEVIPIDSSNHDFSEWTLKTAATCVAPERLIRVCSYNSAHIEEENNGEIDTTAHVWNWTLNAIAATCVQVSKDTATCKNTPCTAINERDGGNAALGHDWSWTTYTSGIRVCQRDDCPGTVGIGDTGPAGGTIFYVAPNGFTVEGYEGATGSFAEYIAYYLEAAPNDVNIKLEWASSLYTNIRIEGTERSIGTGRKNTALILSIDENAPAAKACKEYDLINNWFLPSYDEIWQLYINKITVGNFTGTTEYWTSSQYENDNSNAWNKYWGHESYFYDPKTYKTYVRAIRAF